MELSESGRELGIGSGVLARTPGPILLASLLGADATLVAAQLSMPNSEKAEDISLMIDEKDVLSLLEVTDDPWRREGFAISERVLQREIGKGGLVDLIKVALDRCDDEIAATAGRVRDERPAPRSWLTTPVIEKISARTRSLMIETLFPVAPWHCPERVSILLNNQPEATTLRVTADLGQSNCLQATMDLCRMVEGEYVLEGPLSAVIGPSPAGAMERVALAYNDTKRSSYWFSSAVEWLTRSINVYLSGGPGTLVVNSDDHRSWHYSSRSPKAFGHALRCLSGPGVGQIASQFSISGPIIPREKPFSILVHPGDHDVDGLTFPETISKMAARGTKVFI